MKVALFGFGLLLGALLLVEDVGYASRAPKVTNVKGCEVRISGGEFSTGQEAVFTIFHRGRSVPVLIKITEDRGRGRFEGEVLEPRKCRRVKGARYSPEETNSHLRDLYVYRQWLGGGYLNLSHEGMNVIAGKAGQALPSLIVAQTELELFPLAGMRSGFFEQNLGFLGEFGMSLPVLGEWEVDDGATLNPSWMSYGVGLFARFYLLGAAHPSKLGAKFRSTSFDFETSKVAYYKVSLLRSLTCSGPVLSIQQSVSVSNSFQLFGGGYSALGAACTTPGLTEQESLDLEQQQLEAGVAREDVLISTEIQSDETILSPSTFGFELGFRWSVTDFIATSLQYDLNFTSGELKLINTTRPISFDTALISLSLDFTFGEI